MQCAGCGKKLNDVGGATITIKSLKPKYYKTSVQGQTQVMVCNSRDVAVNPECFDAAWREYSTAEPPAER